MQETNSSSIPKAALPSKWIVLLSNLSQRMFSFQIGWRPFGADSLKRSSIFLRIINILYPILILILLLFNYTYEIIICQGKLNVVTDTQVCRRFIWIIHLLDLFRRRQQQQFKQQQQRRTLSQQAVHEINQQELGLHFNPAWRDRIQRMQVSHWWLNMPNVDMSLQLIFFLTFFISWLLLLVLFIFVSPKVNQCIL